MGSYMSLAVTMQVLTLQVRCRSKDPAYRFSSESLGVQGGLFP
jgi:hypothetical protein